MGGQQLPLKRQNFSAHSLVLKPRRGDSFIGKLIYSHTRGVYLERTIKVELVCLMLPVKFICFRLYCFSSGGG